MFPDEKAFFKQLEAKKLALESLIVSAKSSANAVELDQTKIGRLLGWTRSRDKPWQSKRNDVENWI